MKQQSYILLAIMLLIIFFLVGLKYGQNVEKTNKKITFILSITPKLITATPAPSTPLTYHEYAHKECGVYFVYTNMAEIKNEATLSAQLLEKKTKKEWLSFRCARTVKELAISEKEKTATEEIEFQEKKITAYALKNSTIPQVAFAVRNPVNGKTVYFKVSPDYFPLFEKTLELK